MRYAALLLLALLGCKSSRPADRGISLTPLIPSPHNPYLLNGATIDTSYLSGELSNLSIANGSGLTNLNASSLASGTVSNARLPAELTPSSILFSSTNLYDDLIFNVSTLNPVGPLTGPTIVDTAGRDGEGEAAVFNTGDVLQWVAQMPHTWVTNTTVYPHLHIEPQTANAITNTWIIKYSVADIGEEFPAWTTVTNTVVVDASQQWKHKLVAVPTGGISMTGKSGPSTVIRFRASLTSNVDTYVLSADVHYRVRGSPVAYVAP